MVPHDFHAFPRLAGAYLALAVGQGIVSFADQYLSTLVGERLVLRLRARLFDQIHHLSAGFLERHHLGDVLSRLTGDIEATEEVLLSGVAAGLGYLFEVLCSARRCPGSHTPTPPSCRSRVRRSESWRSSAAHS